MTDEPQYPLPPGTAITWEQAAEAMRKSTGALATEVYSNLAETTLHEPEIMTAIAGGALGWAVNAYFRYWIATGMPVGKIRTQMQRDIDSFWQQSFTAHRNANRGRS